MQLKLYISFIICSFLFFISYGQEIQLEDLQTPNTPGFILGDKSPSQVEKPTNPRAFGIGLLNLKDGGAVEVTPFWLFSHPEYTQESYVKKVPLLSTLNFSSSTYKTDTSAALAVGLKTHLLRLFSANTKNYLKQLENDGSTLAGISLLDSAEIATLPDSQFILVGGAAFKTLSPAEQAKAVSDAVEKLKKDINLTRLKPVFQIELAAAYLGESKTGSFKNLAATKSGVWLNLHYKPEKFPLDLLVLSKYSKSIGRPGKDSAFLDFGFGLSYEKNKFDLHAEYVNRQDVSFHNNYNRVVFVANYQIFNEITLVASFGKNFDGVNDLFTLIGTKIGISKTRIKIH